MMIIVAVEESLLLLAVHAVVGGVEVEDQVLGRLGMGGDELIDEGLGELDQCLAIDAILESTERRWRGEGQLGVGGPSCGQLQRRVGAEGLVVVEVLVPRAMAMTRWAIMAFWSWTMKRGWRGSGMAASSASK